jgi:hypothetical protein
MTNFAADAFPAVRLILAYDDRGFRVIARRRFDHVVPPSEPLADAEHSTGFRVELRAPDHRLLYVRFMPDPRLSQMEVPPGHDAEPFTRRPMARRSGTFALVVPELDEAQDVVLAVRSAAPGAVRLHSDEVARFPLRADLRPAPSDIAPSPTRACNRIHGTTKIVNRGPDAHRWNLVILAEGYRASELSTFRDHVRELVAFLLDAEPFAKLQDAINVHRVDVESCESGADHPDGCNDGVTVDTYFDATFCRRPDWPERLLVVNTAKVIDVLEREVPHWDVGLVVVNSPRRGGSGEDLIPVLSSGTPFGVALHEIGHSAFDLADEYDFLFGPDDPRDFEPPDHSRYDGPEPQAANLTCATNRSEAKWTHLIPRGSQLPTTRKSDCTQSDWGTADPAPSGTIGLFEGAGLHRCGLFRAQFTCRMRQSQAPFCAVCQERIHATLMPYLEPVAVPDVVGMREAPAMGAIREAELVGRVGQRRLSHRPRGEVILQLPRAGRHVHRGTTVTIQVSLGERDFPRPRVPNVVGMTDFEAVEALRAEGFRTTVAYADDDRPFGQVIGQQPAAGTLVPPESTVHVIASRGPGIIR